MNMLKTFMLMELLVPVTCPGVSIEAQSACYILDGILIIYCIVVTALLFRELPNLPVQAEDEGEEDMYQVLKKDAVSDDYEMLDPLRVRAKKGKSTTKTK